MYVTDTYFVVAHFHYIMVGGMVTAYFGGLHYWWPKITGRMYPEYWARAAAILIFFGFNMTFFPQFILGVLGMPRRYHVYPPEFQVWNVLSSAGASILAVAYLLPLFYLGWSLFFGRRAPRQSVARDRARMADAVAAARRTISSSTPDGDARSLPLHAEGEARAAKCLRPQPAFQFADLRQQHEVAQLGMWVFLATEVLFFGGLILALSRLSLSAIPTASPKPRATPRS